MGASASKHKTHGSKRDVNRIPDRPSPPGKPQLVPGTPHSEPDVVTIKWDPPEYDGGAKVTGYLVEHRRTGSPHWVRASPTLVRIPELTLSGLEPGWRYQFRVSAKNSNGMSEPGELSELLTVTLQRTAASAPHFIKELTDIVALENEKAELTVEFRGTPAPTVAWYKDGLEIFSGRRHRILTENGTSTLTIHQTALSDEGEIKCTTTNRVGHAVTKATLRTEAPPSIRLPRQYEEGLLFEKDEVMRLKVTVAGRPVPSVSWLHNGEPLTNTGRYEMAFTDKHATLRVDEARRSDRGEYQVKAINKLGEDIASFLVTVTDRPQAPGKAKVVMTLGRSVTLSWTAPEDDGGCKIGNYIVEYYRLGWNMWLKAATCRQLTTTLGDLIEGSEYKFRVKAENPYGVSDPGEESDILFIPDPHRGLLTPPERRDRGRGTDDIGIEEWLLDPHKRQRETTPGGSPSRDHKKVKKKLDQEIRGTTPDKKINPENALTYEDNGLRSFRQKSIDSDTSKGQQDAPQVPKRRMKRKQLELKGNEDEEEIIKQKIKVIDEGKTEANKENLTPTQDFHGSSELMLVLLPHSRATTEERESTRKEIFDSLKADSPGIAPPMSLSAPELGSIEPERTLLRLWVSSTELLHERAMARFYQAAAEEEAEKSLRRRYSIERRSSSRTRELEEYIRRKSMTGSEETLQNKAKNRLSLPEEILYKRFESTDTSDQSINETVKKLDNMESKSKETKESPKLVTRKRQLQIQSSEDEEDESKSVQESVEEEISEESVIEDEEYMAEGEEDYEMEEEEIEDEFEEEQEEEEEEEEIDDVDMLGESEGEFDERPPYNLEEETYHPRNMTPKSGTFTTITPPSPIIKQKNIKTGIIGNLDTVTDVATAVVSSHSIQIPMQSKKSPTKSLLKPPDAPKPMVRIEVTPPPTDDIKVSIEVSTKDNKNQNKNEKQQEEPKKHIIKPIIKKSPSPHRENSPSSVQFKIDSDQNKISSEATKKQYSPPRFTPDGRHLPNLNPPIPKPILKIRDHSQERTFSDDKKSNNGLKNNTAPLAAVEPELNIITKNEQLQMKANQEDNISDSVRLRKKQVRIEEPENKRSIDIDVNETGITVAGDIARNRRRSNRSNSLIDASDPTKCLIHHYSDIVREFGRVRKVPTTLYLNYDDLKAAAQKSEDNLFDPILESENQINITEENKKSFEEENYVPEKISTALPAITNNSIQNEPEEIEEPEEERELEFLMESPEIKELPQLVLMSEVVTKKESEKEITIFDDDEKEAQLREEIKELKLAEKKVRSFIDYTTDVAMFFIACWLYAFNDERLAIPVLILMVYRQLKDATVTYVKRKIAKLPKLPKLPWKRD